VDVHTAMAAEMLGLSYEAALARKKAGDKEIKEYRQRAKAINFGYPGGLGIKKFVRYARASYGVEVSEAEAKQYKDAWMRRFPEMVDYFRLAAQATTGANNLGSEEHLFTGRYRGNVRYSALCNGRFQGLGADAAKEALWRVTRACYVEEGSTLYGCRVVAFVHDEIICESAIDRAPAAAKELGKVMCEGANIYLSKVPVRAEPLVMTVWSKSAEPTYDEKGALIPWSPV
jgi:DNA polymerase I-like protein with 3'-5' exonuclease and polymerase domains